jgi:3-dehydroquinate dehydratase-1
LLVRFLSRAAYVDIELRSARSLEPVLNSAQEHHIRTIISFHDFKGTPPPLQLDEIVSRARSLGAGIIKIATRTDTEAQLDVLLDFSDRHRRLGNVVAMGLGRLGRASRLEVARRGAVLNYGHLGSAVAAGQLSIPELRRVLR